MSKNAITVKEGESFAHKELWRCAEKQYEQARVSKRGGKYFDMAAMLMAYLSYEAYMNLIGDRLDPDAWADEKVFFNQKEYYGIEGKLKRIQEIAGNFGVDAGKRPYQTVKMLGKFRTELVHAKVNKYAETIKHHEDYEPDWWPNDSFPCVTEDNARKAMQDVEEFIEYVHEQVKPYIGDRWLKDKALKGLYGYASGSTSEKS